MLRFFWCVFIQVYTYIATFLIKFYKHLIIFLQPISHYIKHFAVLITNLILFIFISIPWWVFGELLKPFFLKMLLHLNGFFKKNFSINSLNYIFTFFKNFLINIFYFLCKLCNFFWKKFIDFIFFYLYRNKDVFFKKFNRYVSFFIKFFLFYLFFYYNIYGYVYNYIFSKELEKFFYWDVTTYSGIINIFWCFINPDNIFLLLYILFVKVGLTHVWDLSSDELYLYIGFSWTKLYTFYKLDNPNFCFIRFFIDSVLEYLSFYNTIFFLEYNNTPIFFFFGFLFFTTVTVSWFFFSYLGLYGMFKLNISSLFLFWLSLLFSAKSIFVDQKVYIIKICNWAFLSLNVRVDYYFLIDTISFSFMLLTTTIAFFVYIYAFAYFRYEPLVDRFLLFILSFVISMIFLVTSGNTIMLFLGWELIGLTSFFLINFWTTKTATLKSAFKAFTFNKFSDFFMFIFLVATYNIFYTFDIIALNSQVFKYESLSICIFNTPVSYLEFVSITLLGAAFIKSAQLGGHVWLPDSMEAPVPASSLIHSATLVSAGVYLILRFNFIFDCTHFCKLIVPVMGALTAAYGGVCAVAQSDIKKTLAYSTISHCGFLMVLCSTEMNEFVILYLYVHGFFKAGVFMCVGSVLRVTRGYQDTRRMGGLLKYLPFEYFCASVGLFNLAGLPFTFGFFIKHLLLISLGSYMYIYYFVVFNCLVGAFAGLFYSYRLMTYTFIDFKKANKILYLNSNRLNYNSNFYTNSSVAATLSIFCLFIFSYIITYFMFKYLLYNNFVFSDFMNTTVLVHYYSILYSYNGYLLNFSYINLTAVVIISALLTSKYRRVSRIYNVYYTLLYLIVFYFFCYTFYLFI